MGELMFRRKKHHTMFLYGVAKRDKKELVCMAFPHNDEGYEAMHDFVEHLPGTYDVMVFRGINYRKAHVAVVGDYDRHAQVRDLVNNDEERGE
jgi:hypothetical protein